MTGSYVWLSVEKYRLKKEVKRIMLHNLERDQLDLLTFHKGDLKQKLRWEHSSEFEYLGQMYDVVETVVKRDSVYYLCWPDHRETALNSQLQALVDYMMQHKDERSEGRLQWCDFFKLTYELHPFMWSGDAIACAVHNFPPYTFSNRSACTSPSVPPPKPA